MSKKKKALVHLGSMTLWFSSLVCMHSTGKPFPDVPVPAPDDETQKDEVLEARSPTPSHLLKNQASKCNYLRNSYPLRNCVDDSATAAEELEIKLS